MSQNFEKAHRKARLVALREELGDQTAEGYFREARLRGIYTDDDFVRLGIIAARRELIRTLKADDADGIPQALTPVREDGMHIVPIQLALYPDFEDVIGRACQSVAVDLDRIHRLAELCQRLCGKAPAIPSFDREEELDR